MFATRRLPRIAAVTIALLVGTLTACTSSATSAVSGPQLLWPNQDGGGQVVVPAAKPDAPYSFGSLILCVDRPGTVTIEHVTLKTAGPGIHLDAFAVRPNPYLHGQQALGEADASLTASGFAPKKNQGVDSTCLTQKEQNTPSTWAAAAEKGRGGVELAMQYSSTATKTQTASGIVVQYLSGSHQETLTIPFAVTLCAADDHTDQCPKPNNG